ncbi:hypothetical protein MUO14_04730 [Halobacillus shinanisalinarum]|uniref:SCP2 domain-containing protein n=1 Tax=Halobacillus shinanisalinarum TaxID=2932258 RepID=A0ABY4H1G2_9BACI|nr:hypothetical protein [Halobacillus shinanisalinarum]UOQ94270.1 hypothetical protein MUO14_04730 [Halobacillus shinanisalinarum]
MVEMVEEWIKRVNSRRDLLPKWKKRKVFLKIQDNRSEFINVSITREGMKLVHENNLKGALTISSSNKVFQQLFGGNLKLTSLPRSIVRFEGEYRDVLLVESLLMLSH